MEIKISPEDRLAPKPPKSNTPIFIALAVILGVAGIIGLQAYDQHSQKLAMEARIAEIDREIEAARQTENEKAEKRAQEYRQEQAERKRAVRDAETAAALARLLERDEVEAKTQSQNRQTAFSEKNYTPKGAVNSIPPPARRNFQEKRTQGVLIEKNVGNWTWQSVGYGSRGQKKTVSGQFTYLVKNGRVITHSVCANESHGTLRYRDCRKGAKQTFQRQCKNGSREACSGAEMMP